jgi:hypothetical protein
MYRLVAARAGQARRRAIPGKIRQLARILHAYCLWCENHRFSVNASLHRAQPILKKADGRLPAGGGVCVKEQTLDEARVTKTSFLKGLVRS